MKFEVGQKWRTRDGQELEIKSVAQSGVQRIKAQSKSGIIRFHNDDGAWHFDGREHDYNLITLIEDNMDNLGKMEQEAANLRQSLDRLDKQIAEAKKPKPIRHGDYGYMDIGSNYKRLFCKQQDGTWGVYDDERGCGGFSKVTSNDYVVIGNIFDDMARK